ncbi:MAG TPA: hypothetical protein PKE69_06650 [Pyrinomonadaceae bacterium]|nr:hypothetical protein [Pyrinomonadaceae bacterium]
MNIGRLAWIIAAAIFILVVNVGLSVLYMVIYGYVINPGQSEQFYQDHVKIAAPYCSIFFGIPLFYLVCRWVGGRWEKDFAIKAAISVWIVYAVIDLSIIAAVGITLRDFGLVAASLITKLISAYLGGLSASRKVV